MKPNEQSENMFGLKVLADNADIAEFLWLEVITQTSQPRWQDNAEAVTL